jgi:hypothetical protein
MSEISSDPYGKKAFELEVRNLDIGRKTIFSRAIQNEIDLREGEDIALKERFEILDRVKGLDDEQVQKKLKDIELAVGMKQSEKKGYRPGEYQGYTAGFNVKDD